MDKAFPIQVLERLPHYHQRALAAMNDGLRHLSSRDLALRLKVDQSLVRRDMAAIGITGVPRVGYNLTDLCRRLGEVLGYGEMSRGIVIGAGNLGRALANFKRFPLVGLLIIDLFDISPDRVGQSVGERVIRDMAELPGYLERTRPEVGILATPPEAAQGAADLLAAGGVKGIWNFSGHALHVSEDVFVYTSDLTIAWSVISHRIKQPTDQCTDGSP